MWISVPLSGSPNGIQILSVRERKWWEGYDGQRAKTRNRFKLKVFMWATGNPYLDRFGSVVSKASKQNIYQGIQKNTRIIHVIVYALHGTNRFECICAQTQLLLQPAPNQQNRQSQACFPTLLTGNMVPLACWWCFSHYLATKNHVFRQY